MRIPGTVQGRRRRDTAGPAAPARAPQPLPPAHQRIVVGVDGSPASVDAPRQPAGPLRARRQGEPRPDDRRSGRPAGAPIANTSPRHLPGRRDPAHPGSDHPPATTADRRLRPGKSFQERVSDEAVTARTVDTRRDPAGRAGRGSHVLRQHGRLPGPPPPVLWGSVMRSRCGSTGILTNLSPCRSDTPPAPLYGSRRCRTRRSHRTPSGTQRP
jgi:hypothetical protein